MRMMVMIIYLLFLICMIVYYGKMMYRNYKKELPLGYGQNKIVYFMILLMYHNRSIHHSFCLGTIECNFNIRSCILFDLCNDWSP